MDDTTSEQSNAPETESETNESDDIIGHIDDKVNHGQRPFVATESEERARSVERPQGRMNYWDAFLHLRSMIERVVNVPSLMAKCNREYPGHVAVVEETNATVQIRCECGAWVTAFLPLYETESTTNFLDAHSGPRPHPGEAPAAPSPSIQPLRVYSAAALRSGLITEAMRDHVHSTPAVFDEAYTNVRSNVETLIKRMTEDGILVFEENE